MTVWLRSSVLAVGTGLAVGLGAATATAAPTPAPVQKLAAALPSPVGLGVPRADVEPITKADKPRPISVVNLCSRAAPDSDGTLDWGEASYRGPGSTGQSLVGVSNTSADTPTAGLAAVGGFLAANVFTGNAPVLIRQALPHCPFATTPALTAAGYAFRQSLRRVTVHGWTGVQTAMTVLDTTTGECLTTTHVALGQGHLMYLGEIVADTARGCGNTAGLTARLTGLVGGAVARYQRG